MSRKGRKRDAAVLTGAELNKMSDEEFAQKSDSLLKKKKRKGLCAGKRRGGRGEKKGSPEHKVR